MKEMINAVVTSKTSVSFSNINDQQNPQEIKEIGFQKKFAILKKASTIVGYSKKVYGPGGKISKKDLLHGTTSNRCTQRE